MFSPLAKERLLTSLSRIRLLALDFDGTLTDGTVCVSEDGKETVQCSRKDSLGIDMLKKAGIIVCVISKETNPVVSMRCAKMKIACFQAIETGEGKREILARIMKEDGFSIDQVCYIGDDVNDVPALKFAGTSITVADGHEDAKEVADYITKARGGKHAVREVCELILAAKEIRPHL